MAFTPSWRMFRRMQDSLVAVAVLIYLGAVARAWQVLPGAAMLKVQRTALFPGAFLVASLIAALALRPLRSAILKHLWISYRTGFGQSVISVLGGMLVLFAAAAFIFWQIHDGAHGGRYPGGAFSGYAAGIGLLIAQTILVRRLERDPSLRPRIEGE